MKKILSLFAVVLMALTVSADTDFATPYSCAADDGIISGDAPANKVFLQSESAPHYIGWSDVSKTYTAVVSWTVTATRACYVSVSLDLGPTISSNKHIFEVKILDSEKKELGAVEEGPAYTGDGFTEADQQKALSGKILLPAAGTYTIELRNNRDFCKGTIKNVILTYAGDAPVTDFATPYYCAADNALISGDAPTTKVFLQSDTDPHYIGWSDVSKSYTAEVTWSFIATRACLVNVTLDLGPVISSNKHIFDIELYNDKGVRVDTIAEGPNYTGDGFTEADQTKSLGNILIPAAGTYTLKLMNKRDFCKGTIKNVILTYAGDAPKYYMKGNWNDENPDNFKTKEMVCVARNKYILENVVFGTKGVNWGDDPSWSYGHWETVDEFLGAKPTRLDTVTLALDASTGDITCTILGKYPKMVAKGFDDWGITRAFEIAADEKTASLALNLTELKQYEFKLMLEGQWRSNEYVFKRANNASTSPIIENYNNMKLDVDKAGEYILTWKFEDNSLSIAYPSDVVAKPFEIDLRSAQLGNDTENPTTKYLAIDDLGAYTYSDYAPAVYNAILSAAKFKDGSHGYIDLVATVPVEAGAYMLTLGGCQYQNDAKRSAYVKNEDESYTYTMFDQKTEACYHQNPTTNIVSAPFIVSSDQIVKIRCAEYTPYIKLERAYKVDWESAPEHAAYYSIDKNYAAVGEIVTVTVDPDEGYVIGSIDVPGVEAEKISWVGNTITFPMPAADVEVGVTISAVEYGIVIESMTNGSIEANKAAYTAGETVTLTIKPAEGYKLSSLGIENVDAADIHQEGNTVTFPMPAKVVTVSATFVENLYSLTEFLSKKPTTAVVLQDLTVIMGTGKYTYVIDADGVAVVIYDSKQAYYKGDTLAAGTVITGQKATYTAYSNQDEIIPTNKAALSAGTAPTPITMASLPTAADVNKYIRLENVAVAKNSEDSKYYIGAKELQVYGNIAALQPGKDGNYDLEGLVINFQSAKMTSPQLELIVTKIELKDAPYVPTGAGTEENPYTVADVIGMAVTAGTEDVWVKGYVICAWDGSAGTSSLTVVSNIVLADNAAETEAAKMIPVNLPYVAPDADPKPFDARTPLNIVDNAYLIGKQVSIKGKLQTYFGVPGVKSPSDYKKPEKPSAIDNAEVNAKAVKVIENGQMIIIKNGVKYNAIGEIIK